MNRRDFLKTASGVTGTAAVAGAAPPAVAQEEDDGNETSSDNETSGNESDGNETEGGGGGGGGSETVAVIDNEFDPAELYVAPGTTVTFEWEGDGHNIVVDSQPDEAEWEGHEPIENAGFTHEHTFEVTGDYEYYCAPHQSLGMEGVITVNEEGQDPSAGGGGGEGGGEVDIHELGIPIQAHFVGLATILMILVSLVFSFYVLKYGESPNASSPNRK